MPDPDDLITANERLVIFYCPGCEQLHCVPIEGYTETKSLFGPDRRDRRWLLTGTTKNPWINGSSILIRLSPTQFCHFWVRDGKIIYVGSTHQLDHLTVHMIPFQDWFKVKAKDAKIDRQGHDSNYLA